MTDSITPDPLAASLAVQRVRHELVRRALQVRRAVRISPNFMRVTLAGDALKGFASASFDDHVKLMLPAPGQTELMLPDFNPGSPGGPRFAEGAPRPVMRDYTPRRFDAAAGELDIEFALHGDGPAAAWAAQAQPGQNVAIGGPRGSFVIPTGFDWHLFIADNTGLPAVARRLEELPAGCRAIVIMAVEEADRRVLTSAAMLDVTWVAPQPAPADAAAADHSPLAVATRSLKLPAGEGYAWAAGEAHTIAAVRRTLVAQHGLDKSRIRAASYWKQGAAAHHENLAD